MLSQHRIQGNFPQIFPIFPPFSDNFSQVFSLYFTYFGSILRSHKQRRSSVIWITVSLGPFASGKT